MNNHFSEINGNDNDNEYQMVNLPNNKNEGGNMFDASALLPQEKNDDWFQTIDVNNDNLINSYRPVALNTVGTSHKNGSLDIRGDGDAICPKTNVSPWNQSTIEPARVHNKAF